jgi:4-amino-4-deoxy-L-arabinose transferase-like glycosyltransferase
MPRFSAISAWFLTHVNAHLGWTLFLCALAFRFSVPFFDNPLDNLFSDPARHWQNGTMILNPGFLDGLDPKLYQLYIFVLRALGGENRIFMAASAGLLSVAMAIGWAGVCHEVFSRSMAWLMAIIIAISPSFAAIYSLFMNETLLLTLLGLALWCSLIAVRTQRYGLALLAASLWILACYTRIIALPLAAAVLWYLLLHLPQKRWIIAGFTLVFFSLCAIPAVWHSYHGSGLYTPFGGLARLNYGYYLGNGQEVRIHTNRGEWFFGSPSFHAEFGMPFFDYNSCRSPDTPTELTVNTENGAADWDREIQKLKENRTPEQLWCAIQDNLMFLAFAHSWPDSTERIDYKWLYLLNFHERWLWLPLMILTVIATPFMRLQRPQMLVYCCGLGLLLLLIFQQSAILEGRYRKPLEIFLLLNAGLFYRPAPSAQEGETFSLWQFIRRDYLMPLLPRKR